MPHPSWDNVREFVDLDDFATPGVIQFQAGGTRMVSGIFDDPYLNAQLGEVEQDTGRTRFSCVEGDLAGVKRGDAIVIHGKTYAVMTYPQQDGTGLEVLELELEA